MSTTEPTEPAESVDHSVSPRPGPDEPHHLRRIVVIWLILAVIGDVLFWILLRPHVPPGQMTNSASQNQFDFSILFLIALPVLFAVWVYLAYCIVSWRASRAVPEPVGGAQARTHLGVQVGWIVTTTIIVLGLFTFGTVRLITGNGSGGGQGPNPIWAPSSAHILPVQVIGQQWKFTYRYPTFGGFETSQLVLPVDTTIEFHVTSLDVIHSFWAYQLSVKADANPQQDNVAFTTAHQTGNFVVRCNEPCGIWHGAMFNYGRVVSKADFETWATKTAALTADNTKLLPPYALTYVPDANGADGGYYPDNVDPYSNSEVYGATPGKPTPTG